MKTGSRSVGQRMTVLKPIGQSGMVGNEKWLVRDGVR